MKLYMKFDKDFAFAFTIGFFVLAPVLIGLLHSMASKNILFLTFSLMGSCVDLFIIIVMGLIGGWVK